MSEALARGAAPAVSIVVPVRNEAGNITPLVTEIAAALGGHRGFEVIYVNDGSTDGTESELIDLMASRPWLRQMRHMTSCGQSAAVSSGVRHARASVIVTAAGMVSMAFIVVVAIYASTGSLVEGLLQTLIFGLVGILAQVGGVRLLEWITGIDIGAALHAEQVRAETFVVAAAHVALGLVVAVAVL